MRGVGARRTTCALQTLVRSRTCGWIREWTNERPASPAPVYPSARLPSHAVDLAPLTTLRLGGPAAPLVEARDRGGARRRGAPIARGEPLLVLAGGSNVVVADAGFDGTVVRVAHARASRRTTRDGRVACVAAAGEPWDDLVARCVADGLAASSASSGIPGLDRARRRSRTSAPTGRRSPTTIVVGARARPRDRRGRRARARGLRLRLPDERVQAQPGPLGRSSTSPSRSSAAARARRSATPSSPARSASSVGDRAPLAEVREAVLELRRGKGMVLDPGDHDTVVGRLVLHEPDPRRTRSRRSSAARRAPPRFARARRHA